MPNAPSLSHSSIFMVQVWVEWEPVVNLSYSNWDIVNRFCYIIMQAVSEAGHHSYLCLYCTTHYCRTMWIQAAIKLPTRSMLKKEAV